MPKTEIRDGQVSFVRQDGGEVNWALVSQSEFDGLAPSQIVRTMAAPDHGWEETEQNAKLAKRIDATADADNLDNTENATTTTTRYVVDPLVAEHTYKGLFTGGPVRHLAAQGQQGKQLQQALTRTFCAGHGYTVGEDGEFVYSEDPASIGYCTVEQALLSHRAHLKRIFNTRMAFRSDIPGMYRTEIVWRDFTHESIPHVETEAGREAAHNAARAKFGEQLGSITGIHCETDPNTNTVVIVASALFKEIQEPGSVEDLLAMPRVEGPCTRETLREFGWNDLADGEGYRFLHTFKWYDIKDTEQVRHFLEFDIHDKDVLVGEHEHWFDGSDSDSDSDDYEIVYGLLRKEELRDNPYLKDGVEDDLNGRFAYLVDGKERAWWRILRYGTQVDEQDGTIVFQIVCMKPRWFGKDDEDHRVDAARENQKGLGASKRTVIPSLDRAVAPEVARSVSPDEGHVVTSVVRQQGEAGVEDVVIQQIKAWTWQNGDVPDNAVTLDGSPDAASVRRTSTFKKEAWDISFRRVAKGSALSLLEAVANQLTLSKQQGRATVRDVAADGEGTVTVQLHVEGVEMKVVTEWLRTANYYSEHYRRLRYNVPEDQLEEGGLDENTHEITNVNRTPNDDGTYDETKDRVKPILSRIWTWLSKGRRHGRPLAHAVYRNCEDMPQELRDGTRAGSVSINEHGLYDAQTQEVDEDDDFSRSRSEDHFKSQRSERSTDDTSRLGEARGGDGGPIVSVQETQNGDGTFTHNVSTTTPKECDHIRFVTTGGDRHHRRVERHHIYVNSPDMDPALKTPAEGTNRVGGSDRHNEFGLHDGNVVEYDAAQEDDRQNGKSEDRYKIVESETGSGEHEPQIVEYEKGVQASRDIVIYPGGERRVRVTTNTGKPARWSNSWTARHGDLVGTVTEDFWVNQPDKVQPEPPDDEHTLNVEQKLNEYGLWDCKATYSVNWAALKRSAGGLFTHDDSYNGGKKIQTRRIRDGSSNVVKDEQREGTVQIYVKYGNIHGFTYADAMQFIRQKFAGLATNQEAVVVEHPTRKTITHSGITCMCHEAKVAIITWGSWGAPQ